eukprot:c10111_g1_i1.p1 GENE.c10111_g1_i1~~c10111_g1_i1.p1  ORF type:complete len:1558 (-),score=413.61 c10111_g1_i1:192-4817(-)
MTHNRIVVVAVLVLTAFVGASDTKLYSFGRNTNKQLLQNDTEVLQPTQIGAPIDALCITVTGVTESNSLFVTCDGKLYLTGANIDALGNYAVGQSVVSSEPRRVEGLEGHRVVMASLGSSHIVALTSKGKVFTWGLNADGQLGYGGDDTTLMKFSASPIEVSSLTHQNIRFVTAGGNRTAALSDDGKLFLWGDGKAGEMGDGSTKSHKKPNLVKSLVDNKAKICQVAVGAHHVVAVTRSGDMYSWGDGSAGQLGLGNFGMQQKRPMQVARLRKNVCQVTAGIDFTGVVTQDERVFLWGSNGYPSPFEKVYFQGLHARQIAAGITHMVTLLENGTVASWGSRSHGESGQVSGPAFTLDPASIVLGDKIKQLAVGVEQTILMSGPFPAPSLCPCLNGFFSYWTNQVEFQPVCSDDQTKCGDDSCCGADETCCQVSSDGKSVATERTLSSAVGEPKSSFRCVKAKSATCCSALDSGINQYGCHSGFKCDTDNKRCLPSWIKPETSEEDKISNSEEVILYTGTQLPGANPVDGVCGVRKVTCPDETCCNKGQKCCRLNDGSFGCCPHDTGSCCAVGCCREGYTCDNEKFACVKQDGTEIEKIAQDKVDSHCGTKRTCPDSSCCADGTECCMLQDGFFGCCPFTNGVCCSDGAGCCPSGHRCDIGKSQCVSSSLDSNGTEIRISMKSTPRNTPTRSEATETQCPNGETCKWPGTCCDAGNGKFGCCDFVNGTCCAGGLGCCPADFECDVAGSQCVAPKGAAVPMKFTRDTTPKPHVPHPKPGQEVCAGQTKCTDNTCCPVGSSCCAGPNGSMSCCSYMEGICCSDGGCCAEGHFCDVDQKSCKSKDGESYPYLASQKSAPPPAPKNSVSAPSKCYADERLCPQGMCCPRSSTCIDKGFGQVGCCPQTHAVGCEGGGCCPGGTTCDVASNSCKYFDSDKVAPMLKSDMSHAPEAEWDVEECRADEQVCSGDGGCCLNTDTCCLLNTEEGLMSACCPHENAQCCKFGGCCPQGSTCDEVVQVCRNPLGEVIGDASAVSGSVVHPIDGLTDLECADGSVCGAFDTCCSIGFDADIGAEGFACCPFENAICCSAFEGCCPNGYECDAETKGCVTEGREIASGAHSVPEPPATYVCELPLTQCPNGKCCATSEYCAEAPGSAGVFRCIERGFAACGNASHACPKDLFCDFRNNMWMCSEEQDNDISVKEALLKKFWGEDTAAKCAANSLIQEDAKQEYSPEVHVERAPAQYWFPKKLAIKSKAIKSTITSLPTILAAKVCQHLSAINSSAVADFCYVSNANGHFASKDRDRVAQLIAEYTRRICEEQICKAPVGRTYEFVAEELNPCPCRHKPTPVPLPENVSPAESAGISDAVVAEKISNIAQAEQSVATPVRQTSSTGAPVVTAFVPPVHEVADEMPVTQIHIGAVGGAQPVTPDTEDQLPTTTTQNDSPKFTLVPTNRDSMQLTESIDQGAHKGDADMLESHRPETFMGKEACAEDAAEAAVDLDGDAANEMDAKADAKEEVTLSLAQMNAQPVPLVGSGDAGMPEML